MLHKLVFYDTHGAAEYLVFDPDTGSLMAWERLGGRLVSVSTDDGWVSPFTGVSFSVEGTTVTAVDPTGRRWLLPEDELARAEIEAQRADAEAARADRLAAELAALRAQRGDTD